MRYCNNNGGVKNPENPENVGFLKASEEESKKGKKHRNSITDRANYIKLSFHRHVLKFLLCERGSILTENIVQVTQKQLASLKTSASIWKLASHTYVHRGSSPVPAPQMSIVGQERVTNP